MGGLFDVQHKLPTCIRIGIPFTIGCLTYFYHLTKNSALQGNSFSLFFRHMLFGLV